MSSIPQHFTLKGQPTTTQTLGEEGNHEWIASSMCLGEESQPCPIYPVMTDTTTQKLVSYPDQPPRSTVTTTLLGEEGNPAWQLPTPTHQQQQTPTGYRVWGCFLDDGGIGVFGDHPTPYERKSASPRSSQDPSHRRLSNYSRGHRHSSV